MIRIVRNQNDELLIYLICPQCIENPLAPHLAATLDTAKDENGVLIDLFDVSEVPNLTTWQCAVCKSFRHVEIL